jgi:MFS family permease
MFTTYRTLTVVFVAQCFAQTGSPILVLLAGIVGVELAPSLTMATLPVAAMVVGMALTTIPASLFMGRFGRKAGFLLGAGYASVGGLLAAWSVSIGHFYLFCFAGLLIGSFSAFVQQFRFAVAESVPVEALPRSLSILMMAGIVSAFLGPGVATRFHEVPGLEPYVGSFLGMSVLLAIAFLILLVFYRDEPLAEEAEVTGSSVRSLVEILKDSNILLAMAAAITGWLLMSLVMTATPVSMHAVDKLSLADTAFVIQSHIVAMYAPSLVSGYLIGLLGVRRIIGMGMGLMLIVVVIGFGQPHFVHYWGAMVALGVGWNFLFVGGTTLLTMSYRTSERFRVQALNDFLVFGLQAFGSLGAGFLLATYGWNAIMLLCLPWLIVLGPFLWVSSKVTRPSSQAI